MASQPLPALGPILLSNVPNARESPQRLLPRLDVAGLELTFAELGPAEDRATKTASCPRSACFNSVRYLAFRPSELVLPCNAARYLSIGSRPPELVSNCTPWQIHRGGVTAAAVPGIKLANFRQRFRPSSRATTSSPRIRFRAASTRRDWRYPWPRRGIWSAARET